MTVTKPDGTVLKTGVTGADGSFSLTVGGYTGPFVVRATGGTDLGDDGVAGGGDDLPNAAAFEDVGVGEDGKTAAANPSPFNTLVRGRLGASYSTSDVSAARGHVAAFLGLTPGDLAGWPTGPDAASARTRSKLRQVAALAQAAEASRGTPAAEVLRQLGKDGESPIFHADSDTLDQATVPATVLSAGAVRDLMAQVIRDTTPEARRMVLSGRVSALGTGVPVVGANVEVVGKGVVVATDASGVYAAAFPAASGESIKLTVRGAGYAENQRVVAAAPGGTVELNVPLKPVGASAVVSSTGGIQAGRLARFAGGDLVLATADGSAEIRIATRALTRAAARDALGRGLANAAGQEYRAEITYGDPAKEKEIFPGSFRARDEVSATRLTRQAGRALAREAAGEVPLESVAFLNVNLTHAGTGEPVTGDLDTPMEVRLRLPDSVQARYQAEYARGERMIPWYSYSTTEGIWVRDGEAQLVQDGQGVMFAVASAPHFSWWNVDKPIITHALLKGRVVKVGTGGTKQGIPGVPVTARARDYQGASEAVTGADGSYSMRVRKDSRFDVSLINRPDVSVEASTEGAGDRTGPEGVPEDDVPDLVRTEARLLGRVVWKKADGTLLPVRGAEVRTDGGASATTNATGAYALAVTPGARPEVVALLARNPETGAGLRLALTHRLAEGASGDVSLPDFVFEPVAEFVTLAGVARVKPASGGEVLAGNAPLRVAGIETRCDAQGRYSVRVAKRTTAYPVAGSYWYEGVELRLPPDATVSTVSTTSANVEFVQRVVTIAGYAFYDGNTPAVGAQVSTDRGAWAQADGQGRYVLKVPADTDVTFSGSFVDPETWEGLTLPKGPLKYEASPAEQAGPTFLFSLERATVSGTVRFYRDQDRDQAYDNGEVVVGPVAHASVYTFDGGWASTDRDGKYSVRLSQKPTSQRIFVFYNTGSGQGSHESWVPANAATVTHDMYVPATDVAPVVETFQLPAWVAPGTAEVVSQLVVRDPDAASAAWSLKLQRANGTEVTGLGPTGFSYDAGALTLGPLSVDVPTDTLRGWYEVVFEIREGEKTVLSHRGWIQVIPSSDQNKAPRLGAIAVSPLPVEAGGRLVASIAAWDPDGDPLRYAWSMGSATSDGGSLGLDSVPEGTHTISVTVTDGRGGSATATRTIQIVRPTPVVTAVVPDQTTASDGDQVTFTAHGRNLAGQAVIWTLRGAAVAGQTGLTLTHRVTKADIDAGATLVARATVGGTSASSIPVALSYRDTDGDGLPDWREAELGTDRTKADTDGDGLTDREEVLTYFTDPNRADTDGDGLTDGQEVLTYKTDAKKADTDGDTLSDGAEVAAGTSPLKADTDGDGIPDNLDSNPLIPDVPTFEAALTYLEAGKHREAHGVLGQLQALGPLSDNARALYAVTTLLSVVDQAQVVTSPIYQLLDALALTVVGDSLDLLDVLKDGVSIFAEDGGDGSSPIAVPPVAARAAALTVPDHRAAAAALLTQVLAAQEILDGADLSKVLFHVTESGGMAVEVDGSDAHAFQAGLSALEFLLEFAQAYTYTHDETWGPEFSTLNLQDLRLAAGYQGHLDRARTALMAALAHLQMAGDAVLAETDDQTDDLLTLDSDVRLRWDDLKGAMAKVSESLGAEGYVAIPVFEDGDEELVRVAAEDGEAVAYTREPIYRGVVMADLSALFRQPFAGAALADDLEAKRAEVQYFEEVDPFDPTDTEYQEFFWFHPATSHVAGLLRALFQDVAFSERSELIDGATYRSTEPRLFLRATADGAPLKHPDGSPMGLSGAVAPAYYDEHREVVGLVLPTEPPGMGVGGLGNVSAWVDGSWLVFRLEREVMGGQVSLGKGGFEQYGSGAGLSFWRGEQGFNAALWRFDFDGETGQEQAYRAEAETGPGYTEVRVPLCALGEMGATAGVFVTGAHAYLSAEPWHAGFWGRPQTWEHDWFWGYWAPYPAQTEACGEEWLAEPPGGGGGTPDPGGPPVPVDTDGDGLTDAEERNRGTDPNLWDSDGDGFSDGAEVRGGSDPLSLGSVPQSGSDWDGDGVRDAIDNCPGTWNPGQEDTNNNRIGDACEAPAGSLRAASGYLQYRTYADPGETSSPNLYRGWVQLEQEGAPVPSADVSSVRLLNSAGEEVPIQWRYWGPDWGRSYNPSDNRLSSRWFSSGPALSLVDGGELAAGDYTIEVGTANDGMLQLPITYGGRVDLPFVTDPSYGWRSDGALVLRWTNPTGDPGWSRVERLMVTLLDPDWGDVLYVGLAPSASEVVVPRWVLEQVAAEEQFSGLKFRIQTRAAAVGNNSSPARGYSAAGEIPWAWDDVLPSGAFLQYRTYEVPGNDQYRAWIELRRAGLPIEESEVTAVALLDGNGESVSATREPRFWSAQYVTGFWDAVAQAPVLDRLVAYGGFSLFPQSLTPGEAYTFEVTAATGQVVSVSQTYPEQVALPSVSSGTMRHSWLADGALRLEWAHPGGTVDQFVAVLMDENQKELLWFSVPTTVTGFTIPADKVAWFQGLRAHQRVLWQVQTRVRAQQADGAWMNYARGYSNLVEVWNADSGSPVDTDGDGLADDVETGTGIFVSALNSGSDPTNPDTDGDGVGDGLEVNVGMDPNIPDLTYPLTTGSELVGTWSNTMPDGGSITVVVDASSYTYTFTPGQSSPDPAEREQGTWSLDVDAGGIWTTPTGSGTSEFIRVVFLDAARSQAVFDLDGYLVRQP